MEVMAENERGIEALGYLQEMKVRRDDAVCLCICFFLGCFVLCAYGTLFFPSLIGYHNVVGGDLRVLVFENESIVYLGHLYQSDADV